MSSTPYQTPMDWTLWQIAIALRAVYGVNLTAHSYDAPHSKKLWGYLYVDTIVEYPKANTYEADPMADSHSYQSSVWSWSEPYSTQLRSTHSKKLWGYPYVEYPIANTYIFDADSHSYQSSVWSWREPYGTQLQSTPL